jgi:hypothetical protein
MTRDEQKEVFASGGLYFSADDLKALNLTPAPAVKRLLYKWNGQRKRMLLHFEKQNCICAISSKPMVPDGRLTHLDHIWGMMEAAQAIVAGMPIDEAHAKLWAEENLRAVLAVENIRRNKKAKTPKE